MVRTVVESVVGSWLPVGVRLLDRAMKAWPGASVAAMTPERLAEIQTAAIPERGMTDLVLGRPRPGVEIRRGSLVAGHGELPMRVYTPERWSREPRPLVLNLHGGGFVLGSARQGDWLCTRVAEQLDAVVVSVDYRLAPTHPFPAAVEDCYDALRWTADHAHELGADADRLGVMGDSAGGNLAAVVTILARDEGGPAVRHQALIYPATDLTEDVQADPSYAANRRGIVLPNEDLEIFHGHYLPPDVDVADPRISPVRAPDLSGLPPAVVVVAGLDPLHDSGVRYARALADAGTPVRVEDFHRMPHGFLSFPYLCRSAGPAVRAVVASQRAALGGRS